MAEATAAAQLSNLVDRLLATAERALDGLTLDQVNDTQGETINSIGFDVFHIVRTADNVIHFVFDRDKPVWLAQGLNERWNLPKVDQGTGMDAADAYALRLPPPEEFKEYTKAVRAAIVPRIAGMSNDYLAEIIKINPWGEIPRMEAIGQVLIAHGNGHLGRVDRARTQLGLEGLGY